VASALEAALKASKSAEATKASCAQLVCSWLFDLGISPEQCIALLSCAS